MVSPGERAMNRSPVNLCVFGLNHRTAPVEVREKWSFSRGEAQQALAEAMDQARGAENFILSTCNRTEIYTRFQGDSFPKSTGELLSFFHRFKAPPAESDPSCFYSFRHQVAVEHLFRLSAGLDSMILGEGQILRQIRDAFNMACQVGSAGRIFHRLFPAVLKAGKRVRAETAISRGSVNHGQAAVSIAREQLGDLGGKAILLIGSGKVSRLAAGALRDLGAGRIRVVNRTVENAEKIAASLNGEAYPLDGLPRLLGLSDVVISSSSGTRLLVRARDLEGMMMMRPAGRPLVVIDLAVPRDFEPSCGKIPGVILLDIDGLDEVVRWNIRDRCKEVPRAEAIVQEELKRFLGSMDWAYLDPVIRYIQERFEAIRKEELGRRINKISPEHRETVEDLTSALMKKYLNFPIQKLKSLRDGPGLSPVEISFLRRLFLSGLDN